MIRLIVSLIALLPLCSIYAMSDEEFAKRMEGSRIYFEKMDYGDYSPPIKVSDYDSFLYVYGLLIDYEINAPMPLSNQDKLNQLRNKCRTIGRMIMTQDFLSLNMAFSTKAQIDRYKNDEMLGNYKKDVGTNCKAINDLLKNK